MTLPTCEHICPACGKKYSGAAPVVCVHFPYCHEAQPCSALCAERLAALESYLRTRGLP